MEVLIVEDEHAMARMLQKAISRWGYSVEAVCTGKEAVQKLERKPFDVVLLDILLPDGQGHHRIPRMRALQSNVAIIAMTGYNTRELEMEVRTMGINQYLSKPLDLDLLRMSLDHIAGKSSVSARENADVRREHGG